MGAAGQDDEVSWIFTGEASRFVVDGCWTHPAKFSCLHSKSRCTISLPALASASREKRDDGSDSRGERTHCFRDQSYRV